MGAVVVAPLYVPKPPEEFPWLGKPKGVATVLLAALVTLPPFTSKPTRQINYNQETNWQAKTPSVPLLLSLGPTATLPTVNRRSFDHFVDAVWQRSRPVPLVINPPTTATAPFFNRRQFNASEDIPGFKSIPFYIPVPPFIQLPFQNVRRTEHVPDPVWVGRPKPIPLSIALLPPINLPFHTPRWQGPIPDPDWVKGGGKIPLVQLQLPAQPSFTVKGTRKFDHVPDPYWAGKPVPVSIIYTVPPQVVLPFRNIRQFDHVPEPFWAGAPVPVPFAFVVPPPNPFVRSTRQFHVPDDVPWTMRGSVSAAIYLPVITATPAGSKYTINGAGSDVTINGMGYDVTFLVTE